MIRIVTDTDSNLPQHVVDEYDIALAPIHILFGGDIGSGLGVHVGPGTIGVCWLRLPA